MSKIHEKKDSLKEHEEVVQDLGKQRRLELLQKKVDEYNDENVDKLIRVFEVPDKLTFEQFKDSHVFPYSSANKLKSIYNNFEQANLLNRMSTSDINKLSNHYNNYNSRRIRKNIH